MANTFKSKNPDYRVMIRNETSNISVIADLPEQFGFTVQAQYSEMNRGSVSDFVAGVPGIRRLPGGAVRGAGGALFGGSVIWQGMTKKLWEGTSHINFSLTMLFDAETNAREDVHDVAVSLQALALPIGHNGANAPPGKEITVTSTMQQVLMPPNPPYANPNHNRTELRVGRLFFFPMVVIESADYIADIKLDSTGMPIAGAVQLSLSTEYVMSRQDLLNAASVANNKAGPGK